ncbi:L-threonylcarbamoyladenylate synthase [Methanocaldococcus indicus]|uniref:L-threonylcarbamoyladenylate synthase n=1 Tax=Methanocaldococcus indicus TaxID=213231 RepID=UPI003C6D3E3C
MEIIKIYELNDDKRKEVINNIKKEILRGKIIICGTDTVYGISANALDENAVKRVYEIKKRDFNKPMSICLRDINEIEKYAHINDLAKKLFSLLPGPLTIVLKKKPIIPDIVAKEYIGIRVPDENIMRELCVVPLTTTSANISGNEPAYKVEDIDNEVLEKVDYIIDIGECKYKKPSTVVRVLDNNIELLREGAIPFNKILKIIKQG